MVRVSGEFDRTEAENVAVVKAALAVIQAEGGEVDAKVKERVGGWNAAAIERAMTARPPCRYECLTLRTNRLFQSSSTWDTIRLRSLV